MEKLVVWSYGRTLQQVYSSHQGCSARKICCVAASVAQVKTIMRASVLCISIVAWWRCEISEVSVEGEKSVAFLVGFWIDILAEVYLVFIMVTIRRKIAVPLH